jgi:hypothetical protein
MKTTLGERLFFAGALLGITAGTLALWPHVDTAERRSVHLVVALMAVTCHLAAMVVKFSRREG